MIYQVKRYGSCVIPSGYTSVGFFNIKKCVPHEKSDQDTQELVKGMFLLFW